MTDIARAVQDHMLVLQYFRGDDPMFMRWLDYADSEEKLFSRLGFWLTFRGKDEEQNHRYQMVQDRAAELKLWNGLDLKLRRWRDNVATEFTQLGEDKFNERLMPECEAYLAWDKARAAAAAQEPPARSADTNVYSAAELGEMLLPPLRYIVEGMLPMGMGVLVAKPKIGKSWMVLDLCLAAARGEPFLGSPTSPHGALYLALEDGKSRMQTRLRKLTAGRPLPQNLHIQFTAPRLDEGLLDELGAFLDEHPDVHLVCIDTLSKIKPKGKPFENAYDADYAYMGQLKQFADSRGICVLLVHHTRKSKSLDDSFDNINGSTGIMGAADFTVVLDKRSRMDDEASFILTGRDIEQQERVIRFEKASCRWVMQGTAAELAAQRRVAEYEESPITQTLRTLLLQGDGHWSGNAQALMQMGQRYAHTELAPSSQALSKAIAEMEPLLWERDAIKHWVPRNGTAGKQHVFRMQRLDNTAPQQNVKQTSLT